MSLSAPSRRAYLAGFSVVFLIATSALAQVMPTAPDRYSGTNDAARPATPVGTLAAYTASVSQPAPLDWPGKSVPAQTPTPYRPQPYQPQRPLYPATFAAPQPVVKAPPTPAPPARVAAGSAVDNLPGPPVSPWYVRFAGASYAPPPVAAEAPTSASRTTPALPKSIYDAPQGQTSEIPPQFFTQTDAAGDPPGPSPIYKSTSASGSASTAAHAIQPVDDGSTLGPS
jgi:hypothetical protein